MITLKGYNILYHSEIKTWYRNDQSLFCLILLEPGCWYHPYYVKSNKVSLAQNIISHTLGYFYLFFPLCI